MASKPLQLHELSADVLAAAALFLDRRDRNAHPDGRTDNGGRFYPSDDEFCDCCTGIREPSRAHPWSYMVHCRTAGHVAELHGVDVSKVRRAARLLEQIDGAYKTWAEVLKSPEFAAACMRSCVEAAAKHKKAAPVRAAAL